MKTILVVYTHEKLNKKESQALKRYSFNAADNIKVGMLLEAEEYETPMQVVKILPTCYKFVNLSTGELSNKTKVNSTRDVEIRVLRLRKETTSVIEVVEID